MATYGDGVVERGPGRACSRSTSARQARHGHGSPPAGPVRRAWSSTEDQVFEFTEKPQIGEGWINGGFMVLEPRVLDYIEATRPASSGDVAGAPGRRRPARGLPTRRFLAVHGHAARRAASSSALASGRRPLEGLGAMNHTFCDARRGLVTGATGLVGSWLVKALLAAGAEWSALVRDCDPQGELLRSDDVDRVTVVNGHLEDLARARARHRGTRGRHRLPPRRPRRSSGRPGTRADLRVQHPRDLPVLEACRAAAGPASWSPPATRPTAITATCPTPRTRPARAPPLRRRPRLHRPAGADLRAAYGLPVESPAAATCTAAATSDWNRIVPAPYARCCGASGRDPQRRHHVRDYLYVEEAVVGLHALADRSTGQAWPARPSTSAPSSPCGQRDRRDDEARHGPHDLPPMSGTKRRTRSGPRRTRRREGARAPRLAADPRLAAASRAPWTGKRELPRRAPVTAPAALPALRRPEPSPSSSPSAPCRWRTGSSRTEQLAEPEPRYPLDLRFCPRCSLVQITATVPPEILFRDYVYFSSFSDTMLRHAGAGRAHDRPSEASAREPGGRDRQQRRLPAPDYVARRRPGAGHRAGAERRPRARGAGIPTLSSSSARRSRRSSGPDGRPT